MTFILAFHPDNTVRRPNKEDVSLADFREANPFVPLVDGQWFQLDTDRLIIMNERGEGNIVKMEDYAGLVDSIKNPPAREAGKIYPVDARDAYLQLDGITGTNKTEDGVATGFTVDDQGLQKWIYRDYTQEEISKRNAKATLVKITRLEADITNRRIREAVLGTDNGWLANQESLIATERNKLGE